jgi:hypothetical protein
MICWRLSVQLLQHQHDQLSIGMSQMDLSRVWPCCSAATLAAAAACVHLRLVISSVEPLERAVVEARGPSAPVSFPLIRTVTLFSSFACFVHQVQRLRNQARADRSMNMIGFGVSKKPSSCSGSSTVLIGFLCAFADELDLLGRGLSQISQMWANFTPSASAGSLAFPCRWNRWRRVSLILSLLPRRSSRCTLPAS